MQCDIVLEKKPPVADIGGGVVDEVSEEVGEGHAVGEDFLVFVGEVFLVAGVVVLHGALDDRRLVVLGNVLIGEDAQGFEDGLGVVVAVFLVGDDPALEAGLGEEDGVVEVGLGVGA